METRIWIYGYIKIDKAENLNQNGKDILQIYLLTTKVNQIPINSSYVGRTFLQWYLYTHVYQVIYQIKDVI